MTNHAQLINKLSGGHRGVVVIYSPPTSEVGGSYSEPYVGKMVVSYQ